MICPVCKFGESRGDGPFSTILSCWACLDAARRAEEIRSEKRRERGGTCDSCKKRPATILQGDNMTPTGAYRSNHLCTECGRVRIDADLDQAREAFKRLRDAPDEPDDHDEKTPS